MFKGQRIEIDEYERANLLAALYAATHYTSPLHVLSNGDWIYQLMHKLGWNGTVTDWGTPNMTAEELASRANEYARRASEQQLPKAPWGIREI